MKPTIGRIVHYVSYGTPGGEYKSECRAAIITDVDRSPSEPDRVGLAIFNPTGIFFTESDFWDAVEEPGDPNCQSKETHGDPFRYCACGWMEATSKGGSWHWPEQVTDTYIEAVREGLMSIDDARKELERKPWGLPETS